LKQKRGKKKRESRPQREKKRVTGEMIKNFGENRIKKSKFLKNDAER